MGAKQEAKESFGRKFCCAPAGDVQIIGEGESRSDISLDEQRTSMTNRILAVGWSSIWRGSARSSCRRAKEIVPSPFADWTEEDLRMRRRLHDATHDASGSDRSVILRTLIGTVPELPEMSSRSRSEVIAESQSVSLRRSGPRPAATGALRRSLLAMTNPRGGLVRARTHADDVRTRNDLATSNR